eukprot:TRINITY_DN34518_c0_g1_i2.p1 TRINITY_DN34518_c0_g1~~TRINITY_DN34518_c0_g1_i2.p1  ORF type:complete len:1059 (-),score=270.35 TRINITY_DN34518_c0_g1_i2:78-3254(-)
MNSITRRNMQPLQPQEKIRVGICAMEKKAHSKPMQSIMANMQMFNEFELIYFPEKTILEDRRLVYGLMKANGIPCPKHVVIERDPKTLELMGPAAEHFHEDEDFIEVGDQKIMKPFVEKPVDAEDHNICIYYNMSAGGGCKSLFRKVGDRSSSFDPLQRTIRRDGTYMYEPFSKTQGTDIKIYTVGEEYAHAEARKSPVIDGVVKRAKDGKEVRIPIVLTPLEKDIARRVCAAFGQMVCGFDLLRTNTGALVIDVNGWSFVKSAKKYYDDAARILREHMLHLTGRSSRLPSVHSLLNFPRDAMNDSESEGEHEDERFVSKEPALERKEAHGRWQNHELLAVLAVLRHADRTPKNKFKFKTTRPEFINLHKRYAKDSKKEAKMKNPQQLQDTLDIVALLLGLTPEQLEDGVRRTTSHYSEAGSDQPMGVSSWALAKQQHGKELEPEPVCSAIENQLTVQETEHLEHMKHVLEEDGHFNGIYRKVQLKPVAWTEQSEAEVKEVQVVLKYGGVLTPAGIAQAHRLGGEFRRTMYPGDTTSKDKDGLLRLHATQRHDFKVYSSEEGRVQMSAAAFVRGLLDLEGSSETSLTPISTALVEINSEMLDDMPREAQMLLDKAKSDLYPAVVAEEGTAKEGDSEAPSCPSMIGQMVALRDAMNQLCDELSTLDIKRTEAVMCGEGHAPVEPNIVETESSVGVRLRHCVTSRPKLAVKRWHKLRGDLWNKKAGTWDVSKVPEIHDAAKYDIMHQPHLAKSLKTVYTIACELNHVIVPGEYGSNELTRIRIGKAVCGSLIKKLVCDLDNSVGAGTPVPKLPDQKIVTAVNYLNRKKILTTLPSQPELSPINQASDEPLGSPREAEFAGLDPRHAKKLVNVHRRVRTRLYFTSESHIQTLLNVVRLCHRAPDILGDCETGSTAASPSDAGSMSTPQKAAQELNKPRQTSADLSGIAVNVNYPYTPPHAGSRKDGEDVAIVCPQAEEKIRDQPILDYLTQIVFRLYEDRSATDPAKRYRVEVLFSPGARGHPLEAFDNNHMMELVPKESLHEEDEPLTLAQVKQLLMPFI